MNDNVSGGQISGLSNVTIGGNHSNFNKVGIRSSNNTRPTPNYQKPNTTNTVTIESVNFDKFFRASNITGTIQGEKGSYTFGGAGTMNVVIKVLGGEYYIAKTKADLVTYVQKIEEKRLYQERNKSKFGSKCQSFAYMYAWGLYTNKINYSENNIMNSNCGGTFRQYIDSDINNIMAVVYSEITNGKPVILQVDGDGGRHFVTVVGFSTRVNSPSDLRPTDLLIIDPWDGKLERMDQSGSRHITRGSDYKKDYSGYYLLYISSSKKDNKRAELEEEKSRL